MKRSDISYDILFVSYFSWLYVLCLCQWNLVESNAFCWDDDDAIMFNVLLFTEIHTIGTMFNAKKLKCDIKKGEKWLMTEKPGRMGGQCSHLQIFLFFLHFYLTN